MPQNPHNTLALMNAVEFSWDLHTDELCWQGDIAPIFEQNTDFITSGAQFKLLLCQESAALFEALKTQIEAEKQQNHVNFTHVYCIYPDMKLANGRVWVENFGSIILDENNAPIKVNGIMRVIYAKQNSNATIGLVHTIQNSSQANLGHDNLGRRIFRELLNESFDECKTSKKPLAICVGTLSNLTEINENYGFDAADDLIDKVILVMRRYMRKHDFIGRISGGKFAFAMHNCTEKAAQIAFTRLAHAVSTQSFESEGNALKTAINCGTFIAPSAAATAQDALSKAKEALLDAKQQANKGFNCYSASLERNFNAQRLKEASETIITALNDRRIELAFQPVMNAQSSGVWFYEALVRLRMPNGQLLGAGAFVPIAEKLGLMKLIDHRVLQLALQALQQNPTIMLSVNITPDTTHCEDWLNTLKAAQKQTPQLMNQLIIELTESAVVDNLEWCRSFLIEIKALGCLAAIDDFGAGYTSFRYLRAFDVDIVKIDGGYVMNLAHNQDDQTFVKTLLSLAKSLNLKVVAEWVVNAADATLLRTWGVDGLQGEFTSMPVSNLSELINTHETDAMQKTMAI